MRFKAYQKMSRQEIMDREGWNDWDMVDFVESDDLDEEQSLDEFLSLIKEDE